MSMSRKQYRDIAGVINGVMGFTIKYEDVSGDDACSSIYQIADGLANVFTIDSASFDRERFMKACGIDEEDINAGHERWEAALAAHRAK